MVFDLTGKQALITGGASGIGWAISRLFAAQGAFVHLLEVRETAAIEAAALLTRDGFRAKGYACDVSDGAAVARVLSAIGTADILVNNAGIAHVGTLTTTTEADLDRLLAVNVKGVFHCMQSAIPLMQARGGGVILNLASIASSVGLPDRFAYTLTKGAVRSMTMSVARDYLTDGIRCNCISPARVHTPFVDGFLQANYPGKEQEMYEKLAKTQPIGRMARPEEIAHLALYLCSDEAAFVTGCDYPIDGGFIYLNT